MIYIIAAVLVPFWTIDVLTEKVTELEKRIEVLEEICEYEISIENTEDSYAQERQETDAEETQVRERTVRS
jgi:hypothetical protein